MCVNRQESDSVIRIRDYDAPPRVESDVDCNLYDVSALELRHLRAFVAIADTGHYGRAAASLKLTQPAITQRIQVLERELGVQLFNRNAREVSLTPSGEALIEHARSLVQIEDRALAALPDHQARDDHRILAVEHGPPGVRRDRFCFHRRGRCTAQRTRAASGRPPGSRGGHPADPSVRAT